MATKKKPLDNSADRDIKINKIDLGDVDSVEILCCGDTHFGSPNHVKAMSEFVVNWVSKSRDRYIVFAGDLLDAATKNSVSDSYKGGNPQDAFQAAQTWVGQVDYGIGDGNHHIIAAVEGNHDDRYARETGLNEAYNIFHALKIPFGTGNDDYDGYKSISSISVGRDRHYSKAKRKPVVYTLFLHHGVGGGGTMGAKANMLHRSRNMVTNADIYVCGHTHQIMHDWAVNPFINNDKNKLVKQNLCMIMVPGMISGGYADKKMMAPLPTNFFPVVTLDGHKHDVNYSEIRIS